MGGRIYNYFNTTTLINDIFSGDSAANSAEIYNDNGTVISSSSDIVGGNTGQGDINVDPLLAPLGNNGGLVQTCALRVGSSCLGAGTSVGAPATDARGVGRPNPPSMGGV